MHNQSKSKRSNSCEQGASFQKTDSESLKKALSLLIVCFSLIMAPAVQGDLGIAPQIKELQINRGGWNQFTLKVTNHSDEALDLVMNADDMDVSEQGSAIIAAEGYERGCSDWIVFSPEEFSLDAGVGQSIRVDVKAPKDVKGSYFAILSCRTTTKHTLGIPTKADVSPGLEFGVRVGSLLLLTIRSSQNSVVLDPDTVMLDPGNVNLRGPVAFSEKGGDNNWKIEVPITNSGNVYTIVTGEVSVYSETGRFIARAPLEAGRGFVFPERSRVFTAEGEMPLSDGHYLVRVNIKSKGRRTRGGSFPFTVYNGLTYSGSESDEIRSLLLASSPGFHLNNGFLEFGVVPGSHRTQGVTIANDRSDTIALVPRLLNWTVESDGNIVILNERDSVQAHSCINWLKISPDTIIIAPGRRKVVKVKVQAPEEMNGEYYAAVRFDAEGLKDDLPTVFQLPSTLLLAASYKQTLNHSAEVKSVECKLASTNSCIFEIKVKNTGNVHCYLSGSLELMDSQGERIADPVLFGGEGSFIFPGITQTFTVPWQGYLEPGKYRAGMSISYHEKAKGLRKSITFEVQ